MMLQLYPHIGILLFFSSFNVFVKVHNRSSIVDVYGRVFACDSGPESESAKFYRLQLRLGLKPKRSTLTDSSSGLDSDSVALITAAG